MQIHDNRMLGTFLHDGRHCLLEKIGEHLFLSTIGQCYLWTGGKNNYGAITCQLESGKKRCIGAHRVSYCVKHYITGYSRYSVLMQVICAITLFFICMKFENK